MVIASLSLPTDYWVNLKIKDEDLDQLYNQLLELEMPQTSQELSKSLIESRIEREKRNLDGQSKESNDIYLPNKIYKVGETIAFPTMNLEKATVISVRDGNNPEFPTLKVIEVELKNGSKKQFASNIEKHILNQPRTVNLEDPLLNADFVFRKFGRQISQNLTDILESNEDLVRIAGRWFPRSLLVDVNAGHLNLAEAVLEMENGGPLTTPAFLEQIELPTDVNSKLVEFSLNLALQEDDRFDEVGPAGETLWFLKRLEPDSVKEPPLELGAPQFTLDEAAVQPYLQQMGAYICDELEPEMCPSDEEDETDPGEVTISLIYPHWHAGTLPLSSALKKLFPTAHEAPRVQFNFIDADTNQSFQGWVVRPFKYVFGLHDWYKKNGVIPGSLVHVRRGPNPGEVIVRVDHRKQSREWLRTILVGTDGGIVFAMLKQTISTSSDDRSTIFIPEVELIEKLWSQPNRNKVPLELLLKNLIRELAKLNSQGNVHLEELYSATNILRRCPPGVILSILINVPWVKHLGDLYFRLNENMDEE